MAGAALVVAAVLAGTAADVRADEPAHGQVIRIDPPREIGFRLADGVRIAGQASSWNAAGLDGSFGWRRWSDLHAADREKTIRRLMEPDDASQWVVFGAALLRLQRDDDAERAFARGRSLDASVAPDIEAARAEAARIVAEEAARRAAADASRLSTKSPEAREWPASPWPTLGPAEQRQATIAVRAEAERILTDAGVAVVPVESTHVVVYSDLDRRDAAQWALRLDSIYRRLGTLLGLSPDEQPRYGRIVVFMLQDQDAFRLIETQAFDHLPPRSVTAVAHAQGPMAFINAWTGTDDRVFAAALVHEFVHAFMHGYRTPRRLPPWANDGLAEYAAAYLLEDSVVDDERRPRALQFIRGGGNVEALLGETYAGDWWPGPALVGPAVGQLLVELMIDANHRGFVAWVNAVKHGKDWRAALREDYGVPGPALVRTFVQFYTVND